MGEGELAFGAGNAHIHQPPFFLYIALFNAVGVRQHAFFAADQKYIRIFQPFGSVQGREFDGIDFFFVFAFEQGHQRDGLGDFDDVFAVLLAFFRQPAG